MSIKRASGRQRNPESFGGHFKVTTALSIQLPAPYIKDKGRWKWARNVEHFDWLRSDRWDCSSQGLPAAGRSPSNFGIPSTPTPLTSRLSATIPFANAPLGLKFELIATRCVLPGYRALPSSRRCPNLRRRAILFRVSRRVVSHLATSRKQRWRRENL